MPVSNIVQFFSHPRFGMLTGLASSSCCRRNRVRGWPGGGRFSSGRTLRRNLKDGGITMFRAERSIFGLLAAAIFVFGVHEMRRAVQPVPDSGGSGVVLLPMDEEGVALQGEIDRTQERGLAKRAIVAELLAERLTLRQAAARFQELNATTPERQLARWREICPGNTDEERNCWAVLRYVGAELLDRPHEAQAVRLRLEHELPEHLKQRLPKDLDFRSTKDDQFIRRGNQAGP
jgi:hypothetical protein